MQKGMALLLALFLSFAPAANADSEVQVRIFDYFMGRALKGDRNAQYVVGERYETGLGTVKNIVKAREWYVKAAEQGHEQAKEKLEHRNQPPAPKQEAALSVKTAPSAGTDLTEAPERPAKTKKTTAIAPVGRKNEREKVARVDTDAAPPVQTVMKPVPAPLTAVAPVPPPEPTPIDAMGVVMNARWARGGRAAEILPSDLASCLQASSAEVVCFSEKIVRETENVTVTYTVKSTLSHFTRDGGFSLNYVFNVLRIRGAGETAPAGELPGMAMTSGWQEPGITLQCKVSEDRTLNCVRNGQQAMRFVKR